MSDEKEVVVHEARAVAVVGTNATLALGAMTDKAFEAQLQAMRKGQERITRVQREVMVKDSDYGVIPGTKEPTLLKPGAERLAMLYDLRANMLPERITGDGETEPTIRFQVRADIHHGSLDGPIVAVGWGAANSWEKRYRWRRGELICPKCAKPTVRKSKEGGWFCWSKLGGCGLNFKEDDTRISGQSTGDVENPDPYDLENTLLKIAEKRAYVDGIIRATGTSGLFTQDMEEAAAAPAATPSQVPWPEGVVSAAEMRAAEGLPPEPPAPRPASPAPTASEAAEPLMDLPHKGAVMLPPDGIRMVKASWAPPGTPSPTEKLEVAIKIGRSKHTAMPLGPFARTVERLALAEGETVACDGEVAEIKWAEDKPPKKEIHNVTRFAVLRDGAWQRISAYRPPGSAPSEVIEGAFTEVPPEAPRTAQEPLPDDDVGPEPPLPPAPVSDAPVASATARGTVLVTGLPSAAGGTLPDYSGDAESVAQGEGHVISIESRTTSAGRPFAHGWLRITTPPLHPEDGGMAVKAEVMMPDDEAKAQGAYERVPGEAVRYVGTWAKRAGGSNVLVLTALMPAT